MNKGIFCISIDHELLWGRKHLDIDAYIPIVNKERKIIKRILYLFKKYDIPATWAVVGKIHENGDPLWHGIDTINEIKRNGNQEIASHSYSHEVFTEIDKNTAETEIKKNISKSFVFPKNKIAYLDLLKKYHFLAYRGTDTHNYELILPKCPPVYKIKMDHGIINIPGSLYFVSGRGLRKYIPRGLRVFKAKLGIRRAVKIGGVFHLWFHPIDFATDTEKLFSDFENILKYASRIRTGGSIEIMTMEKIANLFIDTQNRLE